MSSVTETFRRTLPTTICQHFSRVLRCHVYYLSADDSVRCAYMLGQPSSHEEDGGFISAMFAGETVCGRPTVKAARPGEVYIAVDLFFVGTFSGRLAAGPIMRRSNTFNEHSYDSEHDAEGFENALSAACILYHFAYGEWPDDKELLSRASEGKQTEKREKAVTNLPEQTETTHHHSIGYENYVYSLISDGNEKKLLEIIKAPPDGAYGLLDKEHPMRNLKDDCICIMTLSARAAIAGGLDYETAFSMSDKAIQDIEKQRKIDGLQELTIKTLSSFAQRVAELKCFNYSYRINRCRNYILNHIYDKLTVSGIAEYFGLTPEYLSEQFKKETGMKLIDFINFSRAEEAKRLLLFSEKSILDIASLLNYHDQSHFTKAFNRAFGTTPSSFRAESAARGIN